jgi:hypothetical protein
VPPSVLKAARWEPTPPEAVNTPPVTKVPPAQRWNFRVGLAALAVVCGVAVVFWCLGWRNSGSREIDPTVVAAWKEAGATVDRYDRKGVLSERSPEDSSAVPRFTFHTFKPGTIGKLPPPTEPFALDLRNTKMTDAGLEELATLTNLQVLDLALLVLAVA